ncbi:MAG: uracil-DNA glycosylase [Hyphomicrobiales bacterium]
MDHALNTAADAADLLRWYRLAGVDAILDEEPHDRFAAQPVVERPPAPREASSALRPSVAPAQDTVTSQQRGTEQSVPLRPEEAVLSARRLAADATTLAELRTALESFYDCALRRTAKNAVVSTGPVGAGVMIIGDVPDADEDRTSVAFSGEAGDLLDRMLAAIGLARSDVAVTPAIPWRPPGNRALSPHEIAVCEPFLKRQIALVQPGMIVCMSGIAARLILGRTEQVLQLRGKWFECTTGMTGVPTIVSLHPAMLLRHPLQKRHAWQDLKEIRTRLGRQTP